MSNTSMPLSPILSNTPIPSKAKCAKSERRVREIDAALQAKGFQVNLKPELTDINRNKWGSTALEKAMFVISGGPFLLPVTVTTLMLHLGRRCRKAAQIGRALLQDKTAEAVQLSWHSHYASALQKEQRLLNKLQQQLHSKDSQPQVYIVPVFTKRPPKDYKSILSQELNPRVADSNGQQFRQTTQLCLLQTSDRDKAFRWLRQAKGW